MGQAADAEIDLPHLYSRASGGLAFDEPMAFASSVAALVLNTNPKGGFHRGRIPELILRIDRLIAAQLDEILHAPNFQAMEAAWRSIAHLADHVNFRANISLDLLDASKKELAEDFDASSGDVTQSAAFKQIYVAEYDQYGGKPYGIVVGLYEFDSTPRDMFWLRQMGKVAAFAHAPFIAAPAPALFGCANAEELAALRSPEALLKQPRFAAFQALRDSHEAAYIALVLPRFLLRAPWHPETNPPGTLLYEEDTARTDGSAYLWGNPAILFARSVAKAFELTGWCQNVRGPCGGGLVADLPRHAFVCRELRVSKCPIEFAIPDYRELAFANAGFVPLVARPGSDEACFFSCQSLLSVRATKSERGNENARLIANLSYTLSISRIAHYLKCLVRDNVGTTADAAYLEDQMQTWLEEYVTTIINPDDLTLSFYPFKGARVAVKKTDGLVGRYHCSVAVSPHIQFDGVEVELRLESGVG